MTRLSRLMLFVMLMLLLLSITYNTRQYLELAEYRQLEAIDRCIKVVNSIKGEHIIATNMQLCDDILNTEEAK